MNNSYAISKSTAERLAYMYNNDRGGRISTLRAVNAYGPRQSVAAPYGPSKVRKIIPAFVCRALCSQPIEVYGDGQQVSDMVYVGDVARALVQTLITTNMSGPLPKTVEIGPDEHTTVAEVAALIGQLVEAKGIAQAGIKHLPMRPGEIAGAQVMADNSTLGMIGMDPNQLTSLDHGIAATIDWYAERKDAVWHEPARANA